MTEAIDDETWVQRCLARLVELDPSLAPEHGRPVAQDLCERARWRAMPPEQAAQVIFDLGDRWSHAPNGDL